MRVSILMACLLILGGCVPSPLPVSSTPPGAEHADRWIPPEPQERDPLEKLRGFEIIDLEIYGSECLDRLGTKFSHPRDGGLESYPEYDALLDCYGRHASVERWAKEILLDLPELKSHFEDGVDYKAVYSATAALAEVNLEQTCGPLYVIPDDTPACRATFRQHILALAALSQVLREQLE